MRYGKSTLSFVRVAVVTVDSKVAVVTVDNNVIAGFTNSRLQLQRH